MVGLGFTVTIKAAEPVQPEEKPRIEYNVLVKAETVKLVEFDALLQVYEEAPLAIKVPVWPKQIALEPVILRTGIGFTLTVT